METKSNIQFKEFTINKFQIERSEKEIGSVNLNLVPKGIIDKEKNIFIIEFSVSIKNESNFKIELIGIGKFEISN